MSYLFSLTRDSVSLKLKPSQMMTTTLGKVFNLQPDSIFLVGDDGSVATSEDGNFDTYEMDNEVTWTAILCAQTQSSIALLHSQNGNQVPAQ